MSANVERWRDVVVDAIEQQGSPIPAELALAIIEAESTGNPHAYRGEAAISDGSIGLMQILYGTARGQGYAGSAGDKTALTGLFDPATNIYYGVAFLTSLWNQLGNAADVASAYNGGVRPSIGFGATVTKPTTVCLERDSNGKCVRTFTAQPGQYGNQSYVDHVLRAMQTYAGTEGLPPVEITGTPDGTTTVAALGGVVALGILGALIMRAMRS
jgi:soluble lytic murein transglycosylase-like protein